MAIGGGGWTYFAVPAHHTWGTNEGMDTELPNAHTRGGEGGGIRDSSLMHLVLLCRGASAGVWLWGEHVWGGGECGTVGSFYRWKHLFMTAAFCLRSVHSHARNKLRIQAVHHLMWEWCPMDGGS